MTTIIACLLIHFLALMIPLFGTVLDSVTIIGVMELEQLLSCFIFTFLIWLPFVNMQVKKHFLLKTVRFFFFLIKSIKEDTCRKLAKYSKREKKNKKDKGKLMNRQLHRSQTPQPKTRIPHPTGWAWLRQSCVLKAPDTPLQQLPWRPGQSPVLTLKEAHTPGNPSVSRARAAKVCGQRDQVNPGRHLK
uniref:Uncharacterized protein n=1 Tax=Rousettus aegyptiacus TaxID=9407 RepID=A0A7J8FJI9_ROUAE|nr:hypothetical protein HJG63_012123 [Rousettus aegyptiacus]